MMRLGTRAGLHVGRGEGDGSPMGENGVGERCGRDGE